MWPGVFAGSLLPLLTGVLAVAAATALSSEEGARIIVSGLVLLSVLRDLGVPVPLPYRSKQVPEWLRDVASPGLTAGVFGFMLGAGFLTLFTYSTHLAVILALPFLKSGAEMAAVLVAFALGKTVVLLVTWNLRHVTDIESIAPAFRWTTPRRRVLRTATASMSILVVLALIASTQEGRAT